MNADEIAAALEVGELAKQAALEHKGPIPGWLIRKPRAKKVLLYAWRVPAQVEAMIAKLQARAEAVGLSPEAIFEKPRLRSVASLIEMGVLTEQDKGVLWCELSGESEILQVAYKPSE